MKELIIETAVNIIFKLLLVGIEVAFAFLMAKIGKREELKATREAFLMLDDAIMTSVGDLQQTVVDNLKAASKDGKLTKDEILALNNKLIEKTKEKLTPAVMGLIAGAGTDLDAYILSKGEDYIYTLRNSLVEPADF